MYGEIIFKSLIVVALILTVVFIWVTGDPDDYSFLTDIMEEENNDIPPSEIIITEVTDIKK